MANLVITEDRSTALLISLAQSLALADAFPKATARTILALSKATRAALVAQEKNIALAHLEQISKTLVGEDSIYADAVRRKVEQVAKAASFEPKFT